MGHPLLDKRHGNDVLRPLIGDRSVLPPPVHRGITLVPLGNARVRLIGCADEPVRQAA